MRDEIRIKPDPSSLIPLVTRAWVGWSVQVPLALPSHPTPKCQEYSLLEMVVYLAKYSLALLEGNEGLLVLYYTVHPPVLSLLVLYYKYTRDLYCTYCTNTYINTIIKYCTVLYHTPIQRNHSSTKVMNSLL